MFAVYQSSSLVKSVEIRLIKRFVLLFFSPQVNKVLRNHNIKPHWMFALDNIIRKAVQTAITILVPGNVVSAWTRLWLNSLCGPPRRQVHSGELWQTVGQVNSGPGEHWFWWILVLVNAYPSELWA